MTYSTRAEDTAARLHDATRDGRSLLIPGSLEIRPRRAQERVANPPAAVATPLATSAPAGERGRVEHEREGGGAPSERTTTRYGFFGRLCHCVLYPADLPTMWRHSPQEP